jgi:GMP synthase (glutamine-hydrolysing)
MTDQRRSAIALRHVAFEDLGLLSAVLEAAGWTISLRDAAIDDLSDPSIAAADLLIVLGGPIGVYEIESYPFLDREIALLERRLARNLPTLGICLGCQLMAKALGARVFAGPVKEIGWGHVALTPQGRQSSLAPLADPDAPVLHWHGDTFDLPDGAVRLASNAHYDNQAFAYGRGGLALQFHLEADPVRLEEWYVGHAVELASAGQSVVQLRTATAAVADKVRQQAEQVFRQWLSEVAPVSDAHQKR